MIGRFLLACRAWLAILGSGDVAQRVEDALGATDGGKLPEPSPEPPPQPAPPQRSEAIALLESLQREARFVDFVAESIDAYDDAQIGAAAREVHRGCARVIENAFGLRPVCNETEGSDITVPEPVDSSRYRLVGKVPAGGTAQGKLVHPGWEATQCNLPQWTGPEASALVIAAAEVEIA